MGQAVGLGLLSPHLLLPLHNLALFTSSSGTWTQMSQSFQETECLTPDNLY